MAPHAAAVSPTRDFDAAADFARAAQKITASPLPQARKVELPPIPAPKAVDYALRERPMLTVQPKASVRRWPWLIGLVGLVGGVGLGFAVALLLTGPVEQPTPPPAFSVPTVTPFPARVEPPKVEPPPAEASKIEPPKVEPPQTEPPKVGPPKAELPKVDMQPVAEPPPVVTKPPSAADVTITKIEPTEAKGPRADCRAYTVDRKGLPPAKGIVCRGPDGRWKVVE